MKKQRKNNKIKRKENKGITLIALVITIIVLLILAGVSIAMLTGKNGILTQAQKAKTDTENAEENETARLDEYNSTLENWINGETTGGEGTIGTLDTLAKNPASENTPVKDSLGNIVWVPAGFIVGNPTANVEDGIYIIDQSHGATEGSEFVWIPVGTIQTSGGKKTITLSRYTFDGDGKPTDQGSNTISSYYQELSTSIYGNTTAKDIEGFTTSVTTNGGYYIGRYEARDGVTDSERTSSTDATNQVVCTPSNYVYNYVTQPQAASLSQGMYSDSNFESDLMNSYAWDTAIVFIQECSENNKYSRQTRVTSTFAPQGTNKLDTTDVICNIYDMASNCYEWTTEAYSGTTLPCVRRGGNYDRSSYCTATRSLSSTASSYGSISFRPLLYL